MLRAVLQWAAAVVPGGMEVGLMIAGHGCGGGSRSSGLLLGTLRLGAAALAAVARGPTCSSHSRCRCTGRCDEPSHAQRRIRFGACGVVVLQLVLGRAAAPAKFSNNAAAAFLAPHKGF